MSNHIKSNNSDLLKELSEQEQETLTGGVSPTDFASFFFQQTSIESLSGNQTALLENGVNRQISSGSQGAYKFSQTTLAFSIPVFNTLNSQRSANILLCSLLKFLLNRNF
jgi:hypothetical protein